MKKLMIVLVSALYVVTLSGCLATGIVAGAAGGAAAEHYFDKNYEVTKKKTDDEAGTQQTADSQQETGDT